MSNTRLPLKEISPTSERKRLNTFYFYQNVHPQTKLTYDEEKDLNSIVLELQSAVGALQKLTDSMAIELKQALMEIKSNMKKQDESIKKMKKEIKFIKHAL